MKRIVVIALALICLSFRAFCAGATYKQVLIFTNGDSVRVRLPLTDVTGKVRVKAMTPSGFGIPVAPSRTVLGANHYIEWQIGYDIPTTNSPSVVPQIRFQSNGEMKYGHELCKIILKATRLGLISTNDLAHEIEALNKIPPSEYEESRTVQIEVSTNTAPDGFHIAVERLPLLTKTTTHGSVQIQLKQKQRAVGYQAMVYVCLPMNQVLDMNGNLRKPGRAKSKETVYYDFNRRNAGFILDIVRAFGMASQQHNQDMRQMLEKVLGQTRSWRGPANAHSQNRRRILLTNPNREIETARSSSFCSCASIFASTEPYLAESFFRSDFQPSTTSSTFRS